MNSKRQSKILEYKFKTKTLIDFSTFLTETDQEELTMMSF